MALYKSFKICTILVCPRSYPQAQSPDAIGGGYPDETIFPARRKRPETDGKYQWSAE
jgi:hypothetical protein